MEPPQLSGAQLLRLQQLQQLQQQRSGAGPSLGAAPPLPPGAAMPGTAATGIPGAPAPPAAAPAGALAGATGAAAARPGFDVQAYMAQLRQAGKLPQQTSAAMAAAAPARAPQPAHAQGARAAAATGAAAAGATEDEALNDFDMAAGTDEVEEDDTYSMYVAHHIRDMHPTIMGHPDKLVETQSLASIPLKKPAFDDGWKHSLDDCVEERLLSDAQLETVVYANAKFRGPRLVDEAGNERRAGFFLGDGAGVGKGRQIAALIRQHWHEGGRHIMWVSVSNDLRKDAERDLRDIGAPHIKCFPRANESLPPAKKRLGFTGVLFVTYSMLVSGLKAGGTKRGRKKAGAGGDEEEPKPPTPEKLERLTVPPDSRLGQFITWLKDCPHGSLIIFDEAHKAKNLMPVGGKASQTARAVVELQEALPMAKILYSSATGASEPRNLAYMTRLGMWSMSNAMEVIGMLCKARLGALELAAMSMKATGCYLSRTLSYHGAEFTLSPCEMDPVFQLMYDRSTEFWSLLWRVVDVLPGLKKSVKSQFWGAHQRFYKQMLMAAKVKSCAHLARQAIEELGMCVVIGLQSTGEANTNALMEQAEELNDLVSAPKMVLDNYVRNHFPVTAPAASTATLDRIEMEVWEVIERWRQLRPVEEVAAGGAAEIAAEAAGAAQRMGAEGRAEPLTEEEIAAKRLARRAAERKMQEAEAAAARERRREAWRAERGRKAEQLEAAKADAEAEYDELATKLASLEEAIAAAEERERAQQEAQQRAQQAQQRAQQEAQQRAQQAQQRAQQAQQRKPVAAELEDTSDEEDNTPIIQRVMLGNKHVLEDSDSQDSPAPAKKQRSGGKPSQRMVIDDSDSSDSDDNKPLSAALAGRRPLSARNNAGGTAPPPSGAATCTAAACPTGAAAGASVASPAAFSLPPRPPKCEIVELDLTTEMDDDIVCQVCMGGDAAATLLMCEACNAGAHVACLQLPATPAGPWYCKHCRQSTAPKPSAAAAAQQQRKRRLERELETSSSEDEEGPVTTVQRPPAPSGRAPASTVGGAARGGKLTQARLQMNQPKAQNLSSLRVQRQATQRRLDRALRDVEEAEDALAAVKAELAAGPPDTPEKGRTRGAGRATRNGGAFGPRIDTEEVHDVQVEGYRYAVKNKADVLVGLERRGGRGAAAAAASDDGGDSDYDPALEEADEEVVVVSVTQGKGKGQQQGGKKGSGKRSKGDDSDEDYCAHDDCLPSDFEDPGNDPDEPRPSPQLTRIRGWLQSLIGAMQLPPNPLDQLVELLGGESKVAELTGRKGYVALDGENRASYKQRGGDGGPSKELNLREKEAFMSGRKLVAIISDAASTGISLQADRRVQNQRRRCHLTLELPWSADKAIQQFGRSHRANQVSAPLYRILVAKCGGEFRFASSAAKRLQSLGALLRGDRNASGAGTELKAFDVDNPNGEKALERVISDILGGTQRFPSVQVPALPPSAAPPSVPHRTIADWDCKAEPFYLYMRHKMASVGLLLLSEAADHVIVSELKQKPKVAKFLNRLLGLRIEEQTLLFDYFTSTLEAIVSRLKSEGKYEQGMVTLKGQACTELGREVVYSNGAEIGGEVEHVKLHMDRGVSWEAACEFRDEVMGSLELLDPNHQHKSGFYAQLGHAVMCHGKRRPFIILATEVMRNTATQTGVVMHFQRPNVGRQGTMTWIEMRDKGYCKLSEDKAKELWEFWYQYTEDHCYHGDNCQTLRKGFDCIVGRRLTEVHLLTGAVLPIWMDLERLHSKSHYGRSNKEGKKPPLRVMKVFMGETPVVGVELFGEPHLRYLMDGLKTMEAQRKESIQQAGLMDELAAAGSGPLHPDPYGGGVAFGAVPVRGRGRGRGRVRGRGRGRGGYLAGPAIPLPF